MKANNPENWEIISQVMERILVSIDVSPNSPFITCNPNIKKSPFDANEFPGLMFQSYVRLLHDKLYCSEVCYIIAFIYIDRVIGENSNLVLTRINANKLFLASILLAIKSIDDVHLGNLYYATVGRVSPVELLELETVLLKLLNYNIDVDSTLFIQYEESLRSTYKNIIKENNELINRVIINEARFSDSEKDGKHVDTTICNEESFNS